MPPLRPPADLPRHEAGRLAERVEAVGHDVDGVQVRQHIDDAPADAAAQLLRHPEPFGCAQGRLPRGAWVGGRIAVAAIVRNLPPAQVLRGSLP